MNQPLARKEGLIVQELPDEVLVYDASNDKAHCLNNTAAKVWKYCDGKTDAAGIAQNLSRELNAPVATELVWLALDQLEQSDLVEKQTRSALAKAGLSRRDVIKRVGLASLVALPIVTSMLNPMSAHAANCPVNTGCQAGNEAVVCQGGPTQANEGLCLNACNSTGGCQNAP